MRRCWMDVKKRGGLVADRVGFEPTNTREDVTGFPIQRLRPLGHLSVNPAPGGARIIHRYACGGACFGTLNGGGASRQGSFLPRGGGAGVFRAGTFRAFELSGVSNPGGIFSGATLLAFIYGLVSWHEPPRLRKCWHPVRPITAAKTPNSARRCVVK